jgi:hypothetical protein
MKRFFYLISFLMAFSACKEVYEAPPQSLVEVKFINSESATGADISSSITVQGIGVETTWVKDTVLNGIILPLSPNDTTKFLISFDSTVDTLTFVHETTKKYDSMETGFYYEFKIKSVGFTYNRIFDLEITDSLVTKNWHENIKLYIHPLPASNN